MDVPVSGDESLRARVWRWCMTPRYSPLFVVSGLAAALLVGADLLVAAFVVAVVGGFVSGLLEP